MARKKIALLFSGGVDSSAVAIHYLKAGRTVHLLTFYNWAEKGMDLAQYKASIIAEKFPGQSTWKLLDCSQLFHDLAILTLEKDVKKYGNLVCCGCKIAMLCQAIIYCRKNRIRELADGFRKEQRYYPEQTQAYIKPNDAFAAKFGISYLHPLYNYTGHEEEVLMHEFAISPAPIQPSCLFGNNRISNQKYIGPYVLSKLTMARAYVKEALR